MKEGYRHRKYEVLEYDPAWEQQFKAEASTLAALFQDSALSIEHIGSTAVPGLASKPTLDILITVDNLTVVDGYQDAMKRAGYEHLGEYVTNNSQLFIRQENNVRLSNVHIFPADHRHVAEMLVVRDYLRSHPAEVKQYSKLKRELYKKYPDDYSTYRKKKDKYMTDLLQRANNSDSLSTVTP